MVSAYQLSVYRPIFSYFSIAVLLLIYTYVVCTLNFAYTYSIQCRVSHFPLSLHTYVLQCENVQGKIAHSGAFKVTELHRTLILLFVMRAVYLCILTGVIPATPILAICEQIYWINYW